MELQELFRQTLDRDLIRMTLSGARDPARAEKISIRPVLVKERLFFQETLYRSCQVFHKNRTAEEMSEKLTEYMNGMFRQAQIESVSLEASVLVSKKGKATIRIKQKDVRGKDRPSEELNHNRKRKYILPQDRPVDFLVSLGVQTPEGHVVKARYDKFRQINRYLEFIEDITDRLPADRTLRIIDFGCGKSYLTFAMYYYLHVMQGRDVDITGLDLKADVIAHCSELADRLGYDGLHFEQGDINGYEGANQVDMVVSLHACDKATDYALEKAVKWGASVIMAVPCYQHELNAQINCDILRPVLKYGVVRERIAALITDALRACLLEQQGYDTQILEFIDMEHTPKNLMIRAVKGKGMRRKKTSIDEITEFLHVSPVLKELL